MRLSKIILFCTLIAPLTSAAQNTYSDQVQEMYVAYYGRPGDPGGLEFWAEKLNDSGGDLAEIIDEFGTSTEYTERFGGLDEETLINAVYLQLLGRDAHSGGLSFYLERLTTGEMSLASIALDVINGVNDDGSDAGIVNNKLAVANVYTQAVDDGLFDYSFAQIDDAKILLLTVDETEESLVNALDVVEGYGDTGAIVRDGTKNILLIVADDIGVDNIEVYKEQPNYSPNTPNIDSLASDGVLFRNAWANPKCSPSRASLLTGRHAFRHGVTHPGREGTLAASEETIAEVLSAAGYKTAIFGKWHLGNVYPSDQGFDYFSGALGNIEDYYNWEKTQGSIDTNTNEITNTTENETVYATQVVTEESLAWIEQASGPWFVEVAYNAPHSPYHVPPSDRYSSFSLLGAEGDACTRSANTDSQADCYRAAAEAMDSYIGDLLAGIDPAVLANTLIIFVGDNGTPGEVVIEESGLPFSSDHAKGTVYEGGVNVPLIISGGANIGIDSSEVIDLIQIQDLFSTMLDLANAASSSSMIDGQSLIGYLDTETAAPSPRTSQFTELASVNEGLDRWAISNGHGKYIYNEGVEECYDLDSDPGELLEQYAVQGLVETDCDILKTSRPQ